MRSKTCFSKQRGERNKDNWQQKTDDNKREMGTVDRNGPEMSLGLTRYPSISTLPISDHTLPCPLCMTTPWLVASHSLSKHCVWMDIHWTHKLKHKTAAMNWPGLSVKTPMKHSPSGGKGFGKWAIGGKSALFITLVHGRLRCSLIYARIHGPS